MKKRKRDKTKAKTLRSIAAGMREAILASEGKAKTRSAKSFLKEL